MAGIDLSNIDIDPEIEGGGVGDEGSIFDFMNKDLSFGGNKLSDKSKEQFYSDVGELLDSGIDIRSAMEMVVDSTPKKKEKAWFEAIKEDIVTGSSPSEALDRQGVFSNYEIFSVKIGEETGKLPSVLKELGKYFHERIKQRRQITGALTYPVLVLCVAFGAIGFMFYFIVPMFSDVFKRFDGELPWITKQVIGISKAFTDYGYYFSAGLLAIVIAIFVVRKQPWYKQFNAWMMIRIPFFGEIIRKSYLARFCSSMNLMIGSSIPLLRAVGLTRKMIDFYPIEKSLEIVEADILLGMSLNVSLRKFPIYDQKMVSLLKVGEEINKLDTFFEKLGKQYANEVEHKTSMLGSVIEPLLIIFLGVMVAVILISMYLPLFQLSSNFG